MTLIKEQQCPRVTLGLHDPGECAKQQLDQTTVEAGATGSTKIGGKGVTGLCDCNEGTAPSNVASSNGSNNDTLPTDPVESNGHDAAW